MNNLSKFDRFYITIKNNRWYWYFSIFCRLSLAAGFVIAGMVKIMGERFASGLSVNHPMGHYLEALFHTGYYYPFIGVMQITAAVLLLIPRTVTLGAIIYFPIILNICILSFALRFDGSIFTSPLMLLANLYLLCWNYDKLKFITHKTIREENKRSNKFPVKFFAAVVLTVILAFLVATKMYDVMPKIRLSDCKGQFKGTNRTEAGNNFCECIYTKGEPLKKCLEEYENAPDDDLKNQ